MVVVACESVHVCTMCIWRCEQARFCVEVLYALYKFVDSFIHHLYVLYQRHYTTTYNTSTTTTSNTTTTTTTATATIPTIATTNATITIVSEARAAGISITTSPLVANVHTNLFPTSPKCQRIDIWHCTQGAARYPTDYYHRTGPRLSFFVTQTSRQIRSTYDWRVEKSK